MKQLLLVLTLVAIIFLSSCRKDSQNSNDDIIGNWTWDLSSSSGGFQKLSTDSTKVFSIQFKHDYSFVNGASCIIGAQTKGYYQVQKFGNGRILILKAENSRPDTLKLSVSASYLTLTETNNGYSWTHFFDRN